MLSKHSTTELHLQPPYTIVLNHYPILTYWVLDSLSFCHPTLLTSIYLFINIWAPIMFHALIWAGNTKLSENREFLLAGYLEIQDMDTWQYKYSHMILIFLMRRKYVVLRGMGNRETTQHIGKGKGSLRKYHFKFRVTTQNGQGDFRA